MTNRSLMTFYCMVKDGDSYVIKPYVNLYDGMVEILLPRRYS